MKKFKTFSIKIEEGLFDKLVKASREVRVSRNFFVTRAIEEKVEDKVTPKGVTPNSKVTPTVKRLREQVGEIEGNGIDTENMVWDRGLKRWKKKPENRPIFFE